MSVYQKILKQYWGYGNFRPLQEDIIDSVYKGKDTLGLMPTGGGKSITFQVPALAKEGICIVVTPLIALMKDQVENLQKRGIKAIAIYTGMTSEEINIALDNCIYGDFKFLYLSPERLSTQTFKNKVQNLNVNLITVDEAHCISQWGYDFRPSYLEISKIRDFLPNVPILALTATATPEVVEDIQEKLQFVQKNVFRKSFERKNLYYIVRETDDKLKQLLKICEKIQGTGVIYVRNRKKTKEIAEFLSKNNISADYYHAGLSNEIRDIKQHEWKKSKTRIIVSTNAFGMGIDKDDVRFVVHIDFPDSLEAYYQEAGRAGRDEKPAYGIFLYNKSDVTKLEQRIVKTFPEIEDIKNIYSSLGNFFQIPVGFSENIVLDFDLFSFASYCKKDTITIFNSLQILQACGYIEFTEELNVPSRVLFNIVRDELYKFQVANSNVDGFIKLLLRSYTGLFNDFTNIDEGFLAKKAGVNVQDITNYLIYLSRQKVITYIPRKKNPLIVFIEGRLTEKELILFKEKYHHRKEKYISRINSVINYAQSKSKCRSQILLNYFGEKTYSRCGTCDICRSRNEVDLNKIEFDKIINKIKPILQSKEAELTELVDLVNENEEFVIKVIQWLLEAEKISISDNKYKWNN